MFDLLKAVFKYKQKRSPDKLGLYPEAVHTSAIPERRYLWSSRLLVIFASLSICFNIMLVCTLYVMLPQRGATPRLLQKNDPLNRLDVVTKQEVNVYPKDLLTENFIREYVSVRHSVSSNYDALKKKWQIGSPFYCMSSEEVYQRFLSSGGLEQMIYSYQSKGFTRTVDIHWVHPVAVGLWAVRFATFDYYPHSTLPVVNVWQAYVRAVMALISYDNKMMRYQNPFGFLVTSYSLSYLGSPDNIAGYLQKALERRMNLHY